MKEKVKSNWGGKRNNAGRKGFGFEVKGVTMSVRVKHHEEFKKQAKQLLNKLYEND
jgi:uncharacterized protein (UPF0335 family)